MNIPRFFNLWLWALLILMFGCVNDEDPTGDGPLLKPGDSLPDFSVTLNNGESISYLSLEGKIGVIVFFNTACPDCQRELPVVQQLYDFYESDPNVVIAAIARKQDASSIQQYWDDNGLTIPWSPQNDSKIYNLFAPSVIPRIFISNPQCIISAAYDDSEMPDLQTLLNDVESALNMHL